MNRLNTVRAGYLYIICGSLLLGGGVLIALQSAAGFFYSRYAPDSRAIIVNLMHWMINHIGRLPMKVILFTLVSALFFLLRSQKISDDFKALLQVSEELAAHGSFKELEVSSGGELGRLADNLRTLNRRGQGASTGIPVLELSEVNTILPDTEEMMALILRLKTLLRLLDTLKNGEGNIPEADAVKREAAGLERFLENLITGS